MIIEKIKNGLEVHVGSDELIDHFLKLALKQVRNKKNYKYSTAYATNFRIDIRFIETPSKRELDKRKKMLEKAKEIKLSEFINEFRSTGNKQNQQLISRFCNIFCKHWNENSLEDLIKMGKREMVKFRNLGPQSLDLFEKFLNNKGFKFATWTGNDWV